VADSLAHRFSALCGPTKSRALIQSTRVSAVPSGLLFRLTLGFDHRIIDGADAGKFMAELKKYLENWSEDIG
jgi:pyruvate/2-oxoglutarate dehydrogenase complex dihydrolipoamide acyltransferase (E2) component